MDVHIGALTSTVRAVDGLLSAEVLARIAGVAAARVETEMERARQAEQDTSLRPASARGRGDRGENLG